MKSQFVQMVDHRVFKSENISDQRVNNTNSVKQNQNKCDLKCKESERPEPMAKLKKLFRNKHSLENSLIVRNKTSF